MALVVLLRGVNVGGHRRFSPAALARQLRHLDAVNVGAAGTLVVRRPVGQARLRAEVARRLPFETGIMVCEARALVGLLSHEAFARHAARAGTVRFVTELPRAPRAAPVLPLDFPPRGRWLLRLLAREGRFVLGVYRRHMDVIRHLGQLDRVFGAPGTTRNANTIAAIAKVLDQGGTRP